MLVSKLRKCLNFKQLAFASLILTSLLFILTETSRGLLALDSHRVYGTAISGSLIYVAIRLRGLSQKMFPLFLAISFLFPPAILAALLPFRVSESKKDELAEELEDSDLLNKSYGTNLVICRSARLMGSVAISLASELSRYRRVVLVDWNGDAGKRLRDVDHRIANPSDIWLGYPGDLGPSYYLTASEFLSYLTGADAPFIFGMLRGDRPSFSDLKLGEQEQLISSIVRAEGLRLEDALPKLVGVLVIDASGLSVKAKNAISLMTLLQSSVYRDRDFLVIAPLLSPLTDEKLNQRIKDELKWLISSLSRGGCFITSTEESAKFCNEFDNVLECDHCSKPSHKLDGFRLCPWRGSRGRKRA